MEKQDMFIITDVSNLEQPYEVIHCDKSNLLKIRADLLIPVQALKAQFGTTKYYGQLCYVLVEEKETGNYDVFQGRKV